MNPVIYPCLWFDGKAKEAATFYCSVFNQAAITSDSSIVVTFEIAGQKFIGLNGGPMFTPNPSISFFVVCETLQEIDETWNKLQDGGTVLMPLDKHEWSEKYGWVQDKYGVSWQLSYGKLQDVGQKISPSLMFTGAQHGRAEEAIQFYTSIFDNSAITGILKYGANEQDHEGTVKHAQFTLRHSVFMVIDSSYAHPFNFNEAISFVVNCDTQDEIDYFWNSLTVGGEESMCGWLKDKFGVSWQIIPSILEKLMSDPERSQRVVQVFLKMKKFDIEKLLQA
jgi:predicted 3-demethylubiquinone-9 3-methyltransferase (glyoxalase superfamily)